MAPQPPVIDAQGFLASDQAHSDPPLSVCQELAQGARMYGFFQLINHGIDPAFLDRMTAVTKHFFDLPLAKKLKVKRTESNPNGFFNDELTKQTLDLKEGFDFCHEFSPSLPQASFIRPNQWPEGEAEFRGVMEEWLAEMSRASFKLTEALCLGLGLPPKVLHHLFQDAHTSFMRLNWYPVTPEGEGGLGINRHTDAGFLTILVQDPEVAGLQFFSTEDGGWHTVTPVLNALTINIGDQAQVLTNDQLRAPLHRVLSPHGSKPRYSAPFFFNPRADAVVSPLPQLVGEGRLPVYRPISWREFRERRFAGDYADLGEEVQISHYRQQ